MRYLPLIIVLFSSLCFAQNKTDVSLFLRSDSATYLNEVSSPSGDLFLDVGHHGPAIENEYMGLRIYFNYKAAVDVYSKYNRALELKSKKWYPTAKEQKEGFGADYYKAGESLGLGGIRLWDGQKVVLLNPVDNRTARVKKEGDISYLEMLSEGIPYKDRKVDVLVRITVFSSTREARVEAFALTDEKVQFVTGINYHNKMKTIVADDYIATWGLHPEDVAAEKIELGGAIIYDPQVFPKMIDQNNQKLLISVPTKQIRTLITSANSKEKYINDLQAFINYIETIER